MVCDSSICTPKEKIYTPGEMGEGSENNIIPNKDDNFQCHYGVCAICLNKIVLQETALVKGCEHAYWFVCYQISFSSFFASLVLVSAYCLLDNGLTLQIFIRIFYAML